MDNIEKKWFVLNVGFNHSEIEDIIYQTEEEANTILMSMAYEVYLDYEGTNDVPSLMDIEEHCISEDGTIDIDVYNNLLNDTIATHIVYYIEEYDRNDEDHYEAAQRLFGWDCELLPDGTKRARG